MLRLRLPYRPSAVISACSLRPIWQPPAHLAASASIWKAISKLLHFNIFINTEPATRSPWWVERFSALKLMTMHLRQGASFEFFAFSSKLTPKLLKDRCLFHLIIFASFSMFISFILPLYYTVYSRWQWQAHPSMDRTNGHRSNSLSAKSFMLHLLLLGSTSGPGSSWNQFLKDTSLPLWDSLDSVWIHQLLHLAI